MPTIPRGYSRRRKPTTDIGFMLSKVKKAGAAIGRGTNKIESVFKKMGTPKNTRGRRKMR